MRTSDQIEAVAGAIAAVQAQLEAVREDGTNPHFRSRYATLGRIWDAIRPHLAAQGLAIIQALGSDDDRLTCTTRLIHAASGQWIETTVGIQPAKPGPQALGSAATYLRRYSLSALLGVTTGEDDDGEAAERRPERQRGTPRQSPRTKHVASDPGHHPSWANNRKWFMAALSGPGSPDLPAGPLGQVDLPGGISAYALVAKWCESIGRPRPSGMDPEQREQLIAYMRTERGLAAVLRYGDELTGQEVEP